MRSRYAEEMKKAKDFAIEMTLDTTVDALSSTVRKHIVQVKRRIALAKWRARITSRKDWKRLLRRSVTLFLSRECRRALREWSAWWVDAVAIRWTEHVACVQVDKRECKWALDGWLVYNAEQIAMSGRLHRCMEAVRPALEKRRITVALHVWHHYKIVKAGTKRAVRFHQKGGGPLPKGAFAGAARFYCRWALRRWNEKTYRAGLAWIGLRHRAAFVSRRLSLIGPLLKWRAARLRRRTLLPKFVKSHAEQRRINTIGAAVRQWLKATAVFQSSSGWRKQRLVKIARRLTNRSCKRLFGLWLVHIGSEKDLAKTESAASVCAARREVQMAFRLLYESAEYRGAEATAVSFHQKGRHQCYKKSFALCLEGLDGADLSRGSRLDWPHAPSLASCKAHVGCYGDDSMEGAAAARCPPEGRAKASLQNGDCTTRW